MQSLRLIARVSLLPQRWTSPLFRLCANQSEIPLVPRYPPKVNESVEQKRARLIYQSRKRGILENDLLLSSFAKRYLPTFSEEELSEYDHMINSADNEWDLYYWATGKQEIPEEHNTKVMRLLVKFTRNEKRESRLRMPDLH